MLHEACLDYVNELRAIVGFCGFRWGGSGSSGVAGGADEVLVNGVYVEKGSEREDEEGHLAGCELSWRFELVCRVGLGCIDPIVISDALVVFCSWHILCL